jgi:hypothetical protein
MRFRKDDTCEMRLQQLPDPPPRAPERPQRAGENTLVNRADRHEPAARQADVKDVAVGSAG